MNLQKIENVMIAIQKNSNKGMDENSSQVMLCSYKEFSIQKKNTSFYLGIMPKQVQEIEKLNPMSPEIQNLFNEFVVGNMLIGIPPLRSI